MPGWWWEDMPADRAGFLFQGSVLARKGRFQRRVRRQHRLPKVAAERAGPPFMQHITGAVQRAAELILAVIIGAQLRHLPSDRRPFLPG